MGKTFKGFFRGIEYWTSACSFTFQNGLSHFFIYPIAITILLSMGSAVAIYSAVKYLTQFINPYLKLESLSGSFSQKNSHTVLGFSNLCNRIRLGIVALVYFSKN